MLPSSDKKRKALFYWQTKYPQPEHKKKRKKERQKEEEKDNKYSQKT